MNNDIKGTCWHCGRGLTAADYGREVSCTGCGKATRACRNCRHFAPGRPNDCAEPMVERVLEKERPNFCELFEATDRPVDGGGAPAADNLLQSAQDLFK